MKRVIIIICAILAVIACNTSKNPEYMQEATGRSGDIIMIIDSNQWKGPLGDTLRSILQAEVQGLPREEVLFNVINVHPSRKISLLTHVRNLVYVFTLDQKTPGARSIVDGFTPETIEQIKSDTSYFIHTRDNVYSRGQKVMYLFGKTKEDLMRHLSKNGQRIVDFFNKAERERLEKDIYKTTAGKGIASFLRNEQQCELRMPYGYKLADKRPDFIWFRRIETEIDKDIFITWRPYEDQSQFEHDSLIAWRDAVARRYLFEDPENQASFIMTETEVPFLPVESRQMDFNGHYAVELRGLWRTNNKSMGGPFLGYALVDEARGLIYYIEGFTYSPGRAQRETMRELETILWTFRTSEEISPEEVK